MKDFVRLIKLMTPHWKFMGLAVGLGFLTVGSNIGLLAASAFLLASAALHPPVLDLLTLIVAVRFFGISRAVFRYLERYVSHDVTFRLLKELRVWLYSRLEPLAPAGIAAYRSGELFSRIGADVETLQDFYLRVLAPPLIALLVLAGVFGFFAWFELKLALTLVLFFLLAGVIVPVGIRFLSRGIGRQRGEVKAALHAHLVDSLQGMTEIVAFNRVERQQAQAQALSGRLLKLEGRAAACSGLAAALHGFTMHLALWSVLVLAIPLVHSGRLAGTYLAMLALAAVSSFEAVLPLPLVFHHLEESLSAARRLFRLLDARPQVPDCPGPTPKPADYSLRIEKLRFRYAPDEPWILDGLDLSLPHGGRLAVVGPSGAGKSTLINLLLRFWDYQEGLILLGGQELRTYSQEEVRSLFAVVAQHTHLFNATVRENLLLARPAASREEMLQAAREARIHDFIQSLPQGYETYLGEGGFKLSGGQRQRLAIARALLKNAPLLVLDEATAGLDAVTEQEVLESLRRLMAGRTTLIVTHNLAGLGEIDQILTLGK